MMEEHRTSLTSSKIIGVVATNTVAYVETVFTAMERGEIVVPLRASDDHYRITIAGVSEIVEPYSTNEQWMKRSFYPLDSDEVALVAFTSGTAGNPKGVKITHNNLAEVVQRLNMVMQVDNSIKEYIGVPVYHSFGLGRCRAVASAGGSFFIPANGFNPFEIAEMLKTGQINAISAVPSLWRILLENKEVLSDCGKQVKWIEIGSQYMSRTEKEELKTLFPSAIIVQHYGLTEASRTTLLEIHREQGELLESVGQALGGVQVKITQEGRIAIYGKQVAETYILDGQEQNLKDDNGWFTTEDLGAIKNGYLYYQGRMDDVINCGGLKISPEQLETKVFLAIGKTDQMAICRKPDPLRGDGFLVAVTKNLVLDKRQLREIVLQAIQEFGVNAANAISIVEVDELPKTASGKVQRKKLSEQYGELEGIKFDSKGTSVETDDYVAPSTPEEKMLCGLCQKVLNVERISVTDDLFKLGIDSLLLLKLMFKLKSKGLKDDLIKEILSGSTIKELAEKIAMTGKPPISTPIKTSAKKTKYKSILNTTEAINAVRGVAIVVIILNHWIAGFLNKFTTNHELISLLRFHGTPIFALAFGLFLSYLYVDYFHEGKFRRGLKVIYSRTPILLLCILLMGLPDYIGILVFRDFSSTAFVKAIYSIMNYYWLATLTTPFLFYLILKTPWRIAATIILAIVSMSIAIYLRNFVDWPLWQQGWLLLLKLNLLAYYGYFNLLTMSLLGMAIGIFLKDFKNNRRQLYSLLIVGLVSALIGALLGGHDNNMTKDFRIFFPQMFFHAGIALLVILAMLMVNNIKGSIGQFLLMIRSILGTVGIMTLPLFILHGYVIPLKRLLVYLGMPTFMALAIPLIAFFFTMWWLAKTIHRTKATV